MLAALQVVVLHGLSHLRVPGSPLLETTRYILLSFPGVPVFFLISGFLIAMSYENSPGVKVFLRKRLLRIYPGLWASFAITLLLLTVFGYISVTSLRVPSFWGWVLGQLSFVQFYTPAFLRGFGVGTPNGSLWTITVELQFYLFIGLFLSGLFQLVRPRVGTVILLALGVASWFAFVHLQANREEFLMKVLAVSLFPYFFNFLIGILFYRNFHLLYPWVKGKIWLWLTLYTGYTLYFARHLYLFHTPFDPSPYSLVALVLLAFAIFSVAFSYPWLSGKLLQGVDVSYGVYIYHMLVINALVELGYTGRLSYAILAILASLTLGYLSWTFVEKRFIRLKKKYTPAHETTHPVPPNRRNHPGGSATAAGAEGTRTDPDAPDAGVAGHGADAGRVW